MNYLTVIDTGGNGNTTDYAYQYYRKMRRLGFGKNIMLIKGGSNDDKSPVVQSFGKDSAGRQMKDVPLFILNSNSFKDKVDAMLRRTSPGGLSIHFPSWLSGSFYEELRAEVRDKNGKWKKVLNHNESLDLCYYILAGCWRLGLNSQRFNWDSPPKWADCINKNANVFPADEARDIRAAVETFYIPD